jgi:transposase-like protein
MARRKRQEMSEGKKKVIEGLINEYDIKNAQDIQDALADLLGGTIKGMMEAEMDEHLGYEKNERTNSSNARNGYKSKKVRSHYGEFDVEVPQDRDSSFEPKIVPKRNKDISKIDNIIISMYAKGMSTRQISDQVEDIYGFDVSESFISKVTDKIIPEIKDWQNRILDSIYPIVFIDAVHFSVREDGIVKKLAAYVVLGINLEGIKEVLGLYIGQNESSKYWLGIFNELKNRGLNDILILCADGLIGIKQSIQAAYPDTEYQRCIVHQVRNTLKYVSYKDKKEYARDLKTIYSAATEEQGFQTMESVASKWSDKYPNSMQSWRTNWDAISPIYKFSKEVRKVIYTTNAIESLNSSYKRLNKQRSVFPTPESLLKALYLATKQVSKKWSQPLKNWGRIYGEFSIMYKERIPE